MKYHTEKTTEKTIVGENGKKFKEGDEVSVRYNEASGSKGGGFGGATITKITGGTTRNDRFGH